MYSEPILEIQEVRRTFNKGKFIAVDNVSLAINKGEIHALIGPNGAGKTTLVKMVSTILDPSAGRILINGFDTKRQVSSARRNLGVVLGGDLGFYPRATAEQNMKFFADIAGIDVRRIKVEVDRVLEIVELNDRRKSRVNTFSRGMMQRMHIARALLGDPSLLVLDEPTTGLDPDIALTIRKLIGDLQKEGKAILMTSHTMSEIEGLASDISVIGAGKLALTGKLKDVIKHSGVSVTSTLTLQAEDLHALAPLKAVSAVKEIRKTPRGAHWALTIIWKNETTVENANSELHALFKQNGVSVPIDLFSRPANLEDAYLAMASELRR